MEAFAVFFDWKIEKHGYDYHPNCEGLKLNHIAFADDLFLISVATNKSFQVIEDTIREF